MQLRGFAALERAHTISKRVNNVQCVLKKVKIVVKHCQENLLRISK